MLPFGKIPMTVFSPHTTSHTLALSEPAPPALRICDPLVAESDE